MKKTLYAGLMGLLAVQCMLLDPSRVYAESRCLRDVAGTIVAQLSKSLQKSGYAPKVPLRKPVVFVSRNYFIDPYKETIYPFSSYLFKEMQAALTATGRFDVVDHTDVDSHLFVACAYYAEGNRLNITCHLKGDVSAEGDGELLLGNVATGGDTLAKKYWSKGWFDEDARDKMFFLLRKIEDKSCNKLMVLKDKPRVLVNKLRFQNTETFSPFSDYISQYAVDYFTKSNLLIPKSNVAEALSAYQSTKSRNIVPVSVREGSVAAMVNASHYLDGSYWRVSPDEIEVRCILANLAGDILAGESIKIKTRLINPEWLVIPPVEKTPLIDDLSAPEVSESPTIPGVELFTQKGRDNLFFSEGEEMLFLIKTNQPAHIRLFNRGADNRVYQIYPNAFDDGLHQSVANEVLTVPNDRYQKEFAFKVQAPFGSETVMVYASSRPLPELACKDLSYFGVKRMDGSLPEIKAAYTQYATENGLTLSSGLIRLVTRK
ncbi:MAG: DUF4384 domain-containing protein [Nitrospina sp.]|nr:DUF4384 domain-containing protein [Nitrospina sp.]